MVKKINKKELLKKETGLIKEFKSFISRGNVIDLAVGVIIGSAFGKIVTSIVDDILMPIIGVIIGGLDFSNLSVNFKDATIKYGSFIQNVVDFLIVAACIFLLVKFINKFNKKEEVKEDAPTPVKNENTVLLEEIRDLLKTQTKNKK